jgi:hypothetical protein
MAIPCDPNRRGHLSDAIVVFEIRALHRRESLANALPFSGEAAAERFVDVTLEVPAAASSAATACWAAPYRAPTHHPSSQTVRVTG